MSAATESLSCEEIHAGFDVLIARVADLAAERDRAQRKALLQEQLVNSLRAELDEAAIDKRRLMQRCHDLAVTVGALEQQIDHMQNPPEQRRDDHTQWWPFKRAGNAL